MLLQCKNNTNSTHHKHAFNPNNTTTRLIQYACNSDTIEYNADTVRIQCQCHTNARLLHAILIQYEYQKRNTRRIQDTFNTTTTSIRYECTTNKLRIPLTLRIQHCTLLQTECNTNTIRPQCDRHTNTKLIEHEHNGNGIRMRNVYNPETIRGKPRQNQYNTNNILIQYE